MSKTNDRMNDLEDYDDIDLLLLDSAEDDDTLLIFILMLPAAPILLLEVLVAKSEFFNALKTAAQL